MKFYGQKKMMKFKQGVLKQADRRLF